MTDEQKPTPTPEPAKVDLLSPEFEKLLSEWDAAAKQSAYWDEREMSLRKQIFGDAFPEPVIGRNKVRIGHGMALIGQFKLNYTIDQAACEASREFIRPDLFATVIRYKAEVIEKGLRELKPEDAEHFHPFIMSKPGAPALEIKPANKVRW